MKQLIVSRFKENCDWVNGLKDTLEVKIYNKFSQDENPLPNVGREGHTYLTHIINNYDNLADINIFTQGNPFDHSTDFLNKISKLDSVTYTSLSDKFNSKQISFLNEMSVFGPGALEPSKIFWNSVFPNYDINKPFMMDYSAIFAVSKNNLLKNDLKFYKNILGFLDKSNDPLEGHMLERCWNLILKEPK